MIPECITQDLRAGNTLEDTLLKHGTNLQKLFNKNYCYTKPNIPNMNKMTFIQRTPSGTYRIAKVINGKRIQFGTYKTHEDALTVRNELIKCGWDKKQLIHIKEKFNITTNAIGGFRR